MMLSTLALTLTATAQVSRTVDRAALQNRLTDTVSRFEAVNTAALHTSVQTNTQTPATLDRSIVYRNFQQPDTTVKFKVIKNGAVVRTETARVSDIRLAAGEKVVLPERKEVTAVDQATYNKLKDVRSVPFARADLQMIPELTIESKDGGTRQIEYHLYFFPYQPFTYNDSLRLFQSKMGFFYLRSDSMNVVNAIDPVNIIVTSDALGQIHPRPLKIDHLSFPPADLDLAGKGITDSVAIRIITASKPEGYQTFVKIRPVLDITTDRRTLQGYGIQKIPIEVRLIGSNSSDSMTVNVSAAKGTITPAAVTLRYNTPQTVYLTSEGLGPTSISAKSSNLESAPLPLTYVFPWYFLIASLLGGVIGGLAKYYTGEGKKFSMRPIIGGILAGFIGAIAYYALGISLLHFKFSAGLNEVAVLALSALVAYFGIPKKEG